MTKCPDCGKDLSKSAASCPNCGRKLRQRTGCVAGGCAALLVLAVGLYLVGALTWPSAPPPAPAARPTPVTPPTTAAAAPTPTPNPCAEHVELKSLEWWARELDRPPLWVAQNHKINLWNSPEKQRKVGEMRPGSRAMILAKQGDQYQVRSPLDQSVGWVSAIQVTRTLFQDVNTREPCSP